MGKTKDATKPVTKYERRRDIDEENAPRYVLRHKIDDYNIGRDLRRQLREPLDL